MNYRSELSHVEHNQVIPSTLIKHFESKHVLVLLSDLHCNSNYSYYYVGKKGISNFNDNRLISRASMNETFNKATASQTNMNNRNAIAIWGLIKKHN